MGASDACPDVASTANAAAVYPAWRIHGSLRVSRRSRRRPPGAARRRRRTGGPAHLGRAHHAGPDVLRSRGDARSRHAVHDPLRAARRAGEADAGQARRAVAGRVVDRVEGRAGLRVRPAHGREVPQRRAGHAGGREVLVRALPRRRRHAAAQQGGARGDTRRAAGAPGAQAAVGRLHDLLRQPGHRGRLDRAQGLRREGRARTASRRRPIGAGPYRFVSSKPGVELVLEANEQYWRKVPSVKTLRLPRHHRRVHAPGRAQARRGRHRLQLHRAARRGAQAHAGPHAGPRLSAVHGVALPHRAVGPKSPWADVRVRRAASLAIDRPAINQSQYLGPGALAVRHRAGEPGVLLGRAQARLRSQARAPAAGRGRLPERLRRRRGDRRHDLRHGAGRARRQLPAGRGHPRPTADRWSGRRSPRASASASCAA